jgi:hypothetical protein
MPGVRGFVEPILPTTLHGYESALLKTRRAWQLLRSGDVNYRRVQYRSCVWRRPDGPPERRRARASSGDST